MTTHFTDPQTGATTITPAEEQRFWAKVDRTGGPDACWLWIGNRNDKGYGRLRRGSRTLRAHRVSWLISGRPLTDGLVLDHLCRNRACVNVRHLREVTLVENVMAPNSQARSAINAAKTHCGHGHEFTPANTYITPKGDRACRTCGRLATRAYRSRRSA